MSSQAQIDANRRNAQRSTGPATPQGRAAVRHNALKHGLTAELLIPSMEYQPEFDRLCDAFETEYQPVGPTEESLLENLAAAKWRLSRAHYEARLECSFYKALTELRRTISQREPAEPSTAKPTQSDEQASRTAPAAGSHRAGSTAATIRNPKSDIRNPPEGIRNPPPIRYTELLLPCQNSNITSASRPSCPSQSCFYCRSVSIGSSSSPINTSGLITPTCAT